MPFLSFIRRPVFLSLRARIILLTCLMPLLASGLVGGFAYWRMTDLTVKTSLLGFATETHLMAQRVEASYDEIIRLSVIDHGPGIPVSFQNRVFEKFAQAEETTAKVQGGSGLGLYLAKTILEAFNGHLSFETEEGKGSAFHIDLPPVLSKENEAA